jgi:hypothetical protein
MRTAIGSVAILAAVLLLAGCGGGGANYSSSGKLVQIETAPQLPSGATGQPYQQGIAATFPNPPGTYSVSGGSLPLGLTLQEDTGQLSGYPRSVGTFHFEIAARDGPDGKLPAGRDVTYAEDRRDFTIVMARGPVQILPQTLPIAQYRGAYGYQIDVAGGTAPYTFQQTGGTLPAGLVVSPSGFIGSFPTQALEHPYHFTVTVTDATGGQDSRDLTVDVVVLPLAIETVTIPDASEGFPYDAALSLSSGGGGPPYTWSQVAPGPGETQLSTINMSVSGDGHVKSITSAGPTLAGLYAFTVQVTDEAQQTVQRSYTLKVRSSPVLTSITPRISNATGPFTAAGTGFLPGAVLVFNPGIQGSQTINVTYVNSQKLTFASAPSSSIKGPVTVRVLNPDGGYYDLAGAMLYPANSISFGTKGFIASGLSTFGLAAADLNGDGRVEILHAGAAGFKSFTSYAGTSAAGGLHYIKNNGNLQFTVSTLDTGNFTDVALADVDSDGDLDVIALAITSVKVWLNDGAGNLTAGPVSALASLPSSTYYTTEMAIGYFNGDKFPDIVYGCGAPIYTGAVYTAMGNGSGGFTPSASVTSGMGGYFYGVNGLTTVDVNGDGLSDVVPAPSYYSSGTPMFRIGIINSGGSFASWATGGSNTPSWGGASNSPPCVIVTTTQDPPDSSGGVGGTSLTLYYGSNLGSTVGLSIPAGLSKTIGLGDFDFDGIQDWAVSHKIAAAGGTSAPLGGQPDRVLVYRGSTGSQMQTLNLQSGTPTVTAAQSGRIASGDVDGDGRPDILIGTSFWATDNQQSTYYQRGDSADGNPMGIVFYLNTSQ